MLITWKVIQFAVLMSPLSLFQEHDYRAEPFGHFVSECKLFGKELNYAVLLLSYRFFNNQMSKETIYDTRQIQKNSKTTGKIG